MKIDEFKNFVRNNPHLIKYVKDKKMTWQQFYEIYDLYGANDKIWDDFNNSSLSNNTNYSTSSLINTIKEIFGLVKGIDLKSVQKALTSLNQAIEAFKGFNDSNENNNSYDERPKNKYYED